MLLGAALFDQGPDALVAETTLYLLGILASLGLWLSRQIQGRSGRIHAIDLFDRFVVRFSLYVLPGNRTSCSVHAQAQGRIVLPSMPSFRAAPRARLAWRLGGVVTNRHE
jgi:hypothetical protein